MNKRRYLVIVGIVAAVVLISILFYTMLANHRPAITSLEASERVLPSGSCQIACNASDRDGDELSYNWSASGGNISGTGGAVNWTAPDSAGSYNVTVIVIDGRGGEDMEKVTIEVRTNNAPKINSPLMTDANWTTPSGSIQVTCDASDPDGDELNYEWTTTRGSISGTGAVVNWTAPQEVGTYNVTVVVKDGHGREDTRSVCLSVATGTPPTIEELIVTAKEPKYLKKTSAGYKVGRTKQYDIGCIASNTTGEMFYKWSCTGGELSGEGSTITWTAPDASVDVTVAVIVSDVAGNGICKSIVFEVVPCNTCAFG